MSCHVATVRIEKKTIVNDTHSYQQQRIVIRNVQHLHFDYFEKWDYSHWKLRFCNLWWENCSSFQWDKYVAIIVSERFDVTRRY